jgi:hypothetical protein
MHSSHLRKGGPWWILLCLAVLWLISSAAGAMAQPSVNPENMPPAGTEAHSPPRDQAVAALDAYQGTPVGFTADGLPFRGHPQAP